MSRSLYVVEWRDREVGWTHVSTGYSLRAARKSAKQIERSLVFAVGLRWRIRRWVRPDTVGTHGWMQEVKR